jgi:hypothetical protein
MLEARIKYNDNKLPNVVDQKVRGRKKKFIPYNITENNGVYTWEYIEMNASDYTYGGVINVLIGLKYELQQTLAILSNYLSDPKNSKYIKEFEEFQACRKEAKDYAKKLFDVK